GQVYVVTNFPAIIRVDGLDTLQRLPPQTINLTPQLLEQARSYLGSKELAREATTPQTAVLTVPVSASPEILDGKLSTWDQKQFVIIDNRSTQVGNRRDEDQQTTAAMKIAG